MSNAGGGKDLSDLKANQVLSTAARSVLSDLGLDSDEISGKS